MVTQQGELCQRLREAIVDGRFLEDPAAWRSHIEQCEACRQIAEGLLWLRECVREAALRRPAPRGEDPEGREAVRRAFADLAHQRRVRRRASGVVLLLALVGGLLFAVTRRPTPPPTDPVAYATQLHDRIFPPGQAPQPARLLDDPDLLAEYRVALDHPSSLVRRTALDALMFSGVDVEVPRLEAALTDWQETLDRPLELASKDAGLRALRDALWTRRVATLRVVLLRYVGQAARDGTRLDPAAIRPFLGHPDEEVAIQAVRAASYAAEPDALSDEVAEVFDRAHAVMKRREAGCFLIDRQGEAGVSRVVASLRARPSSDLERMLAGRLVRSQAGRAFAKDRARDPQTPLALAVTYHGLSTTGQAPHQPLASALLERAARAGDADAVLQLAHFARVRGWGDLGRDLHAVSARLEPSDVRDQLIRYLVGWAVDQGTAGDLTRALDRIEESLDASFAETLERIERRTSSQEMRARVQALRTRLKTDQGK